MVEINIQESTIITTTPLENSILPNKQVIPIDETLLQVTKEKVKPEYEEKEVDENRLHLDKIIENILKSICDYMTLYSDIAPIQDEVINARMREITKNKFSEKIGIAVMNFLDDVRDYATENNYEIQFRTGLDDYIDSFVYEKANQFMCYFYPAIVDGWLNYNYNTDTYTGFDRDEFGDKITEFITITLIRHTFQEYNYEFTETISSSENTDSSENNSEKQNESDSELSSAEQLSRSIEDSSNTDCIIC
jgi:hypothetical protein